MAEERQFPQEEEARLLVRTRLKELRRLLDMAEDRVENDSLFRVEADLQIVAALCETTASQVLRTLQANPGTRLADAGSPGLTRADHDAAYGQR